MMTQPIRIGIVGCGSVMTPYMSAMEKLRLHRVIEVVAACDVKEEKRQYVLDEFGVQHFTTDYRELVQSDDVDLVLVLTSMQEHGPVTRAALEAGKHVLVEKPMAVTLDGLQHLVECIQQHVRPIITPEQAYHVLEIMIKAQESGADGQAKIIESTFTPQSFGDELEHVAVHLIHDRTRDE
jgi:predicted dehydrogenase